MLITCITHADARDKKKHPFRGLTEQGWQEVNSAAEQFRELIDEETPIIETIVSSPKARCVETAILFAKAVSELTATSEIQLDPGLEAGTVRGGELFYLAKDIQVQHLLVSGHADLARTMPPHVELVSEAAKDGWFTTRPVLFQIEHEAGNSWDKARVLYCLGLVDGEWLNLLQPIPENRALPNASKPS